MMNDILMTIIAFGALIGGIDKLLNNKFHLGEKFDEALNAMGSLALSMAGIICLAPLLADVLSKFISPLMNKAGFDPAILGSTLAIDMGGYQLSTSLAQSNELGKFFGIICSAMLGCTLVFTLPVGMSLLQKEDRPYFLKGIMYGFVALPFALLIGGLLQGLDIKQLIWNLLPIVLISLLLLIGLVKKPNLVVKIFSYLANFIKIISIIGLSLGAFQYISAITLIGNLTPLMDAMATVASIAIVMIGSMPLAELLRRAMAKPFNYFCAKTNLNDATTTGVILGLITVMPSLMMVKDMNKKGKIFNAAFLVCGASVIGAHMGFATAVEKDLVIPLIVSKFVGAILAVILMLLFEKNFGEDKSEGK